MTSHESVKRAVAQAICDSSEVAELAVRHFGRGLKVIVNAYGDNGFPGEEDAPYAFIYSDGENEIGNVADETFEFVIVIGGCDEGGLTVSEVSARTDTENGLVVSGIMDKIEQLRAAVEDIVRGGRFGAVFNTASRTESEMLDWPLEWASLRCSFYDPQSIND